MFSFSSALWLAAASAMITAELFEDYDSMATCESSGLTFKCAHTVICADDGRTTLDCDSGVINIHSVNFGQRVEDGLSNSVLQKPCQSSNAATRLGAMCNGLKTCDVRFSLMYYFGYPCEDPECLEVFYFCGPLNKVCEKNGAKISCDAGDVIRIHSSHYDQHDKSVCSAPQTRYNPVVCTSPEPLAKVAKMCDGKNSCVIRADSDAFVNPCEEPDKSLALSYSCIETLSSPVSPWDPW